MSNNLLATGSATGNPRNKVALKPGFSLVGWIRLTNSGEDLTGTNGKRFSVTKEELAKHCTPKDCWTAIRGRVYNITRYLEFHPGGINELMRGAGKDATNLFDEFHPWVNIDQLLAKCFIGPLKTVVTLDLGSDKLSSKKSKSLAPPQPSFSSLSPTLEEDEEIKLPTRIIPRFDWIQKSGELMIYFYTKALCNPGLMLKRVSEKECEGIVYIGDDVHTYKFSFLKSLLFPPRISINHESGKIEIIFKKEVEEVWSNFGIFEKIRTSNSSDELIDYHECDIVHKKFINHDSFEFSLRPKNEKIFISSLGFHFNFKLKTLERHIIRSYTPITFFNEQTVTDLHFLIKKYEMGVFSKYLSETSNAIFISQQRGSFDLSKLKEHTRILFLAAGSGLTPFLRLTEFLLNRNSNPIQKILLLFFNKTQADIWCREKFDKISLKDSRFTVKHVLSEATEDWEGGRGRLKKEMIESIIKSDSITFTLYCGNAGFNEQSREILSEYTDMETHCFDG